MALSGPSAVRAALTTFAAFAIVGSLPLLAYIYGAIAPGRLDNPLLWSCLLTALAFFVVGALKSRFVEKLWWSEGLKTLGIGGCAAVLAYAVGALLKDVF
jgi:VIT1/CCC1 family predicted Fe2+/Mn2+ transporter